MLPVGRVPHTVHGKRRQVRIGGSDGAGTSMKPSAANGLQLHRDVVYNTVYEEIGRARCFSKLDDA